MEAELIEYINVVETAKLVREVLKAEFPGVKFSVRVDRAAWINNINVRWTDGPPRGEREYGCQSV